MTKIDLADLPRFLERRIAELRPAVSVALAIVGAETAEIAKAKIGEYQPEVGPFRAWAELAESTKADRVAKGFTENDPLLRTGELRDSIGFAVEGLKLAVGSTDRIAVYQEFGTAKIPPRSFLGASMVEELPAAQRIIGEAAQDALAGNPARRKPK